MNTAILLIGFAFISLSILLFIIGHH